MTWLRPSLTRRVLLALVLAFLLVWAVLLVFQYLDYKRAMQTNSGLQQFTTALGNTIKDIDDEQSARIAMKAIDAHSNNIRAGGLPGHLLFALVDKAGHLVYASNELHNQSISTTDNHLSELQINGVGYWVCQTDTAEWSLHVAEPRIGDTTILEWLARDLLTYLLLAFPIVTLTMWIAVRLGLRPLKTWVKMIEARPAGDLSPVQYDLKYVELQPLVDMLQKLLQDSRGMIQRERELTQDVAHELQTPLAVIIAQAEMFAQTVDANEREQSLAYLVSAISRASHLLRQLLALNALDEQLQKPKVSVDLARLVREVIAQSASTAMARGIELSLEGPDQLVREIDQPAFLSIVQNLLDNAVRYNHAGGKVEVSMFEDAGNLLVSVADNGPGIAPEDQSKIFERFYRGRQQDTRGSGLGLSIVRQAVQRLQGSIALSSGSGGSGCRFTVVIPVN